MSVRRSAIPSEPSRASGAREAPPLGVGRKAGARGASFGVRSGARGSTGGSGASSGSNSSAASDGASTGSTAAGVACVRSHSESAGLPRTPDDFPATERWQPVATV